MILGVVQPNHSVSSIYHSCLRCQEWLRLWWSARCTECLLSLLLGFETSEGADFEEVNSAVELLLGTVLLVLLSGDSNSDFSWHISATSGPEEVV